MSCSISQALADDPGKSALGTLNILAPQLDAVIIPEIEFREIAVKVLFAAMLVDVLHAALEKTKVAFGGINMNVVAGIFFP